MGIYSDNKIYGVCFDIYDISNNFIKNNEKIYETEMNKSQIQVVKFEYDNYTEDERKNLKIYFYTSTSITCDVGSSSNMMMWCHVDKDQLEQLFTCGCVDCLFI